MGADRPYGAVSTDSRTLVAGALFVALKGPKFDGGEFVAAAAQRGAVGALVEKEVTGAAISQIVVSDTLEALQRLLGRVARVVLDSDRRRGRQQRQDHRQGDDRGDSRRAAGRAWRPTAISTITSACR